VPFASPAQFGELTSVAANKFELVMDLKTEGRWDRQFRANYQAAAKSPMTSLLALRRPLCLRRLDNPPAAVPRRVLK